MLSKIGAFAVVATLHTAEGHNPDGTCSGHGHTHDGHGHDHGAKKSAEKSKVDDENWDDVNVF